MEAPEAQLCLAFGSPSALRAPGWYRDVRATYPKARVVGCSTAGEILGDQVLDDSVVVTAVEFAKTAVHTAVVEVPDATASHAVGAALGQALDRPDLRHVLVFSDGLHVNGSDLVAGLAGTLPAGVGVTGGLSADGDRFQETVVVHDAEVRPRRVVGVGLCSPGLSVGCGSLGGWDPFGPERVVTRSAGNVLYELDGQPALDLYKAYLGEAAAELPASALRFPLNVRSTSADRAVVRTVLSVDTARGSMTFAGDVPEGALAQLMRANYDRLIDGAAGAAKASYAPLGRHPAPLALLISCVGRRLVLGQRVEEELESVRHVLGDGATLAGFYSYGEISPFTPSARCELHNQTMTITILAEA